jgi:uridine kinase
MKNMFRKRMLNLKEINRRILTDSAALIEEENEHYRKEVESLTRFLTNELSGRRLVMLSGPSSSGKTTTALLVRDHLRELGMDAHTVSIDNFYRGREQAPKLENGNFDYESLEAIHLDQLQECMHQLVQDGHTWLPTFDFVAGQPAPEKTELQISSDSVVIFEGIHALNPVFEEHMSQENLCKVFVNTISPVFDGDEKLLARRDIRLVRRILRDERFRNSPVENTLQMWQQVIRGENMYMFPYVDTVDFVVDTTHAYEPGVFASEILPSLRAVEDANPYIATVRHLIQAMDRFESIPMQNVPRNTMLREFIGDGMY